MIFRDISLDFYAGAGNRLTNRSSGHSDPQKTDRTATRERKQFQDKARNTI